MTDYISIKAVLDPAYFPRPLRQETDDDTILSNALSAYRLLNVYQKYEEDTYVTTFENHSLQLPDEINTINLVTYLIPKDQSVVNDIYNLGNYDFLPLRYVGNRAINLTLKDYNNSTCKVCTHPELNACSETYTITPFREMTLSLKEGCICIDYLKEVKDEYGNFLIIKDENVLKFLATYAAAIVWRDRAMTKEEQGFQIWQSLLQQAELLMKKAKGSLIQRNLDLTTIDSVGMNTYNMRLSRVPSFVWNKTSN